jgi:hypothetical protein
MLELSTALPVKNVRTLIERVRARIAALGCERVWARSAGSHVLLGLCGTDAYARITPLGGASYGLAFRRAPSHRGSPTATENGEKTERSAPAWQPLFLVDTLSDVVEHALIAVDALPSRDVEIAEEIRDKSETSAAVASQSPPCAIEAPNEREAPEEDKRDT